MSKFSGRIIGATFIRGFSEKAMENLDFKGPGKKFELKGFRIIRSLMLTLVFKSFIYTFIVLKNGPFN